MAMKWISVKYQLPQEHQLVLVFAGIKDPSWQRYEVAKLSSLNETEDPIWETDNCCQGETVSKVTHWMELPEKPQ